MTRVLGLLVTLAVVAGAAGQTPPSPAPSGISIDPEALTKTFGNLTPDSIQKWFKNPPTNNAEAETAILDLLAAHKFHEQASRHHAAGEFAKARDEIAKSVPLFLKHLHDDSPMLFPVYGTYGIEQYLAGDVPGSDESFRKQRVCAEKLFPPAKFPTGHSGMALALLVMGSSQQAIGRSAAAEKMFRDALKMYEEHGPVSSDGSDLTTLRIQLTWCTFERREFVEAEAFARKALADCEKLCSTPTGRTKFAHLLAKANNNLGEILRATGRPDEAKKLLDAAADLNRGSPDLSRPGINTRNQAMLALESGDYSKALNLSEEALRSTEAAFPAGQYPKGHPQLVTVLRGRGEVLAAVGELAAAQTVLGRCLDMVRIQYPDDRCPDGHPELAETLTVLADAHLRSAAADDQRAAARHFRDSLRVTLGHTRAQGAYLSEAAMLRQLQVAARAAGGLLSVTGRFDPRDYWFVWESKAAAMRLLDYRRRAAVGATDPAVRRLIDQLAVARADVSAYASATDAVAHDPAVVERLTQRKEELERQLAAAQGLPLPPRTSAGPAALCEAISPTAVFLDFWAHVRTEQDPANPGNAGRRLAVEYSVFVLAQGRDVVRVPLGAMTTIDNAVDDWLKAIVQNPPDPLAERKLARRVADLVWEPLRPHLPAGLDAVYVCPDGSFGRLPFAALPDQTGVKVLLESAKVVEVPHGPGLHARLTAPPPPPSRTGHVLAVAAVNYGPGRLGPLDATATELKAIRETAGLTRGGPVCELTGTGATADAVLEKLATARVAHFATHAFADDPALASGYAARNPLVACGLALSGANTGGVLLGETIAGRRADSLELAVLSACNTGRGPVLAGEGVFALRRAFHVTGCPAVVASLWAVDDQATAALMARFYHHLWADGRTPEDALWKAQLDLYRSPVQIPTWASGQRGDPVPDVPRVEAVTPLPVAPPVLRESLPRRWAGFQVSVTGPR